MGALIWKVFLRHVPRIKKMSICPPFEVLDAHFSLLPQEQTYYTTQANNDACHCNFTCDCDFTLFIVLLPVTSVRASYYFLLLETFSD